MGRRPKNYSTKKKKEENKEMIWTVITINAALQRAEHHVFGTLSHDGATAYQKAQKELPNTVIVAMVKGSHKTGTYVPNKTISVFC